MRAEEVLKKQKRLGLHDFYYEDEEIIVSMREYAKLKCQELLEIVAEKAKMIEDGDEQYEEYYLDLGGSLRIDKDSILSAVDLEKFCS